MFDYQEIFKQRGDLYNRASARYPSVRRTERQLLIDLIRPAAGMTICDAPAGGGYLADGIAALGLADLRLICIEPSAKFAAGIHAHFDRLVCPLEDIALGDATADAVGSLAGLHHLPSKIAFFREARRVLKPGGTFAVADILDGTPPARFLNGPCDRLSETGHDGVFVRAGELTESLRACGFTNIVERHRTFTWDFPGRDAMVSYCKDLFGLTRANDAQVGDEIDRTLGVVAESGDGGVGVPWSLVYACGVR